MLGWGCLVSADEHKRLYGRWLSELWSGDLAVADEITTPDFVGHRTGEPAKVRGPRALADTIGETHGYFKALTFDVEVGPVAEGDIVAARWKGRGTLSDDTPVTMHGHDVLRVESARLAEFWALSEQPRSAEAAA